MMLILAFLNLAAQYGHGPGLSDVKTKLRCSMLRASRPSHRQCPASRVPLLAPAALQAWHPCISIKCIVVQTTNCRGPGAATGVHRSRVPQSRAPGGGPVAGTPQARRASGSPKEAQGQLQDQETQAHRRAPGPCSVGVGNGDR